MKLELDFEDLERQWKDRQLDLFPWLDGLFALLRTRESIIRETKKRLFSSTQATMVQFLSSDDHENALVAKEIIKQQDYQTILPILLYSLEKVSKKNYPHRIMESLIGFDPVISFGYLFGYLNLRTNIKDKIFLILNEIFPIKDIFTDSNDGMRFLGQIFQALRHDLRARMPSSGRLEKMEEFDYLRLDLMVMLLIFHKTWQDENAKFIENEMQKIGQDTIVSLHKLPFDYGNGSILFQQFSEIIPYMAMMRLKPDKSFLKELHTNIKSCDLTEEEKVDILEKSEAALKIIDQPEKTIDEILEQSENKLFSDLNFF